MGDTFNDRFERLIAAHTGLQLRQRERDALRDTLAARMAALHLRDADEYYQLLQSGNRDAECEWEHLAARLTNNESYFFRDKGQMDLLREHILPELIARNQERRTLRLWSAGCSTGEEPYSLAMLVDELLPERGAQSGARWEIVILGTDIDEQALKRARQGVYSSWSFRTMEPARQQRCFHRQADGWHIGKASRSLVSFRQCNLVRDRFPSTTMGIYEMDLILCRNVFIYFASEAVSAVLPKLSQTLREGGYLMTGHAETQGRTLETLQPRMFPESVVYQRVSKASVGSGVPAGTIVQDTARAIRRQNPVPAAISRTPITAPRPARAITTPHSLKPQAAASTHTLEEAEALYAAGNYPAVVPILQSLREPAGERALLLGAHAHANLGHYDEATDCCERLMKIRPLAPEPYEVLASIAQEQKRYDDAKLLLKKALYLAPDSPSAYLELGALYRSEGDVKRGRTMHAAALDLLQKSPPGGAVGSSGGPPAHEWILHLKQLLAEGE